MTTQGPYKAMQICTRCNRNNAMKSHIWKLLTMVFAALLIQGSVQAQNILGDFDGPDEYLINEEVCFTMYAWNTGPVGYQPYFRLFLPPETPAASLSVEFLGEPVSNVVNLGVFSGAPIEDSNLPLLDANVNVTGPDGYSLLLVNIPVGSLADGGVNTETELCVRLNGPSVEVAVPVEVQIQPIYRYGDTPTGDNGSISGAVYSHTVTPTLYRIAHRVDQAHAVSGSCTPLQYGVEVDIAEQEIVTDMVITAELPDGVNYLSVLAVTPGCVVVSEPAVNTTGDILVQCNNANGTPDPVDVELSYFAYLGDELDVNDCDSLQFVSNATVGSNEVSDQLTTASMLGYHITFTPVAPSENIWPGETVSLGVQYRVSEYVDGIDSLSMTLTIPDGLTYIGNANLDGTPLAAYDITPLGDGRTDVSFDVFAVNGAPIGPCATGNLTFECVIEETYDNGDYLNARDQLYASGLISYSVQNGVEGCVRPVATGYNLPSAEVAKEILTEPANELNFVPGEEITYRLSMEIPSGDAMDVVFEDLFPIPIHDVQDLSLVWGEDIVEAPTSNASATPSNIYIDIDKNALYIDFGDVSSPSTGIPLTLAVDITIDITDEPFADDLIHTNFARFYSNNSLLEADVKVDLITINAGAPELLMFKGIVDTDQPNESLAPIMIPVNANASGIDAWDYVDYRVTLVNTGQATAYDVIVTDFPPFPEMGNCTLINVEDGNGDPMTYTGSLFTTGLVIDEIPRQQNGTLANQALVNYQCRVQGDISIRDMVVNTAEATWTGVDGSPNYFNPITESSQIFFARPEVEVNVLEIVPGYAEADEVQVGELVTLEARIRMPEGFTRDATFEVTLPEGMSVEELIEFDIPDDTFFSAGSTSQVTNGITITDVGVGVENQDRRITITMEDIHNDNSDNNLDDYLSLRFKATVLNTEINQNGYVLEPSAVLTYLNPISGSMVTENGSTELTLVEPELDFNVAFFAEELLPGSQTFVTITVGHSPTSTGNAYNVDLTNDLPLGIQFIDGSFLTECDELIGQQPSNNFGSITASWDSIPLGVTCEIVYTVEIVESFPPCTFAENCMNLKYASGFEAHYDTLSYGPTNPLGVRRTGNTQDTGGALNDQNIDFCAELNVVSGDLTTPTIIGENEWCSGEQIILSVPTYPGTFVEYHWDGPGVPDGYTNNQLIIPSGAEDDSGIYTLYVQVGECETDVSAPFGIIVQESPSVSVQNVNIPCSDGSFDLDLEPIITGGTGPYDFVWTGPNFFSADSVAVIENIAEDNSGAYSVVVSDVYGCNSQTATAQVNVSTAPPIPSIQNGAELCQGLSFTLTTDVFPGAIGYHWQTPDGEIITNDAFLTISDADPVYTGSFQVWVQLEDCETETSLPVNVTVHPSPEMPQINANELEFCEGETLILSSEQIANQYIWEGPNAFEASTQSPPAIEDLTLLNAGEYSLTLIEGLCSSETVTVEVVVNERPQTPGLASNSPLCEGDALLLTTGASAELYEWELPGGVLQTTTTGSLLTGEANISDQGEYTVSVFNGICWSEPSEMEMVQIDVIPEEQAFAGSNVVACEGEAVEVQADNDETLTGLWTIPDGSLVIASPNTQHTVVTGVEEGQSYTLVWSLYTDGCGVYSTDEVVVYTPVEPVAVNDVFELVEDEQQDVFVVDNDYPGPVEYSIEIIDLPDNGSAQVGQALTPFIEYEPDLGYSGEDELVYELCLDDCPSMCDTALLKLTIFPYLRVPDIITPNGDGVNDALQIEGIERFPSNEIVVFNRWGRRVFEAEDYQNDWEGVFDGKPLPHGTYFYVFNNRATGETLSNGYITIHQ